MFLKMFESLEVGQPGSLGRRVQRWVTTEQKQGTRQGHSVCGLELTLAVESH